eukprot:405815-Pleurochrysis_carterae.AAC.1
MHQSAFIDTQHGNQCVYPCLQVSRQRRIDFRAALDVLAHSRPCKRFGLRFEAVSRRLRALFNACTRA